MLDLNALKMRKEELEKSSRGIEYLPAPVRKRTIMDIEAYKELIYLREKENAQ